MIQAHAQFSSSCRSRHLIVPWVSEFPSSDGGKGTKFWPFWGVRPLYIQYTPGKLTNVPLKINGWKMYSLLKWSLFGGHSFVFGGVVARFHLFQKFPPVIYSLWVDDFVPGFPGIGMICMICDPSLEGIYWNYPPPTMPVTTRMTFHF